MSLTDGSRQVAPTLSGIRRDHLARYEWAADRLAGMNVVDAGCGIGYGSTILASRGCRVFACDIEESAISYAREHYNHNDRIAYELADLEKLVEIDDEADAVVCFEALEHLAHPERALRRFREIAKRLYVSVPNEDRVPFSPFSLHHMRHYRRAELEETLRANGWRVVEWWGQEGTESAVEREIDGRTLVAVAVRTDDVRPEPAPITREMFRLPGRDLPRSVAIVAMGASSRAYLTTAMQAGDRRRYVDEVWAINNTAGVILHDRVFHMDDLHVQRARADAEPGGPLAAMMGWLTTHDRPVYTSRAYPDIPCSVEYPIEWVLNQTGHCYFNNTVPYALAFAIALGVEEVHLFGCDYGYPDDKAYKREKGRACLEYWIAVAASKEVAVNLSDDTTLLDACEKKHGEVLYGYDTEWVRVGMRPGEGFWVSRVERRPEHIPTAEQMNVRYMHDTRFDHMEGLVR